MKRIATILSMLIMAFALSMCNNAPKPDEAITKGSESAQNDSKAKSKVSKDACVVPVSAEDSAKYLSKQLEIKGEVEFPMVLTVDSLKKMNVATIENFMVVCQSGANMKEDKSCKGVLLKDIMEKAKIIQNNHKDRNFYIVARATDDYKATFSWAEIFNNPTGENVYVLFEENGMPIKEQGDMILICKNDIKTGPRHVYWLKSIEVNRVD